MDWRTRRKLHYTFIALLPLLLIAGVVYYSLFFPDPTCFDGEQNGNETGVDCGGSCEQICQSSTADVKVDWAKSFSVSDNVYNAAARIQNPNVTLEAQDIPYRFRLYDKDGLLITERRGEIDLLPQPTTLVFEPGIVSEGREVDRTEFDLLETPFWKESALSNARFPITNKTLTGATSSNPRLTFDVTNEGVRDYTNLRLSAVVFDGTNRPVHVSETEFDTLPARSTKSGIFTWRQPFPTRTISCTVPSNIMLLLDRSGSMNEQGSNPPQPLTAVKQAATDFVQLLGEPARSGLISFATESTVDQRLTNNHTQTRQSIDEMFIREEDERGFTNMGAAVRAANTILRDAGDSRRTSVLIILTDGKANAPEDPGGEVFAQQQINTAKENGVLVYTIGLGDDVNQQFLNNIASQPANHFSAVDRQALSGIYEEIHNDLCEQAPFITEITPTHYELDQ